MKWVDHLVLASSVYALAGCGSILSGTSQNLDLAIEPAGAVVSVYRWNGEPLAGPAPSPGKVRVHRPEWDQPFLIRISKPGYCPEYVVTDRSSISPGGWGTVLVFNGLIPLMIDQSTGGLYSINPDPVEVFLEEDSACVE
jgi:hypothetical protein